MRWMPAVLAALILIMPFPLWPADAAVASKPVPSAVPSPGAAPVTTPVAASVTVFSDAEWNSSRPADAAAPSSGAVLGRAAFGLGISLTVIIALAVGLGLVVKKLGKRRLLPGRGRHLEVIETVPLGFKRAVSLIRLGDQVLVVGQGEHELHHLATLPASVLGHDAQPETDPLMPSPAVPPVSSAPPNATFRTMLERLGSGRP